MKPLVRNVVRSSGPGQRGSLVQAHGGAAHQCRANACAANNRAQVNGPGQANRNVQQLRGADQRPSPLNQRTPPRPLASGPRSANYNVQTPIPLGGGSQRIRATIPGSPQVAGSVEIRTAGAGRVYISNLQVDQQHRRRGVAAKLIDAAVSTARRQGFKAASLEARPSDNGISPQALVAMYRRQGFKSVGKSHRGSPLMERKL